MSPLQGPGAINLKVMNSMTSPIKQDQFYAPALKGGIGQLNVTPSGAGGYKLESHE